MSEYTTLLGHVAYVASVTMLTIALVLTLLINPVISWFDRFEATSRIRLLKLYVALPILAMMISVGIMFLPGVTHNFIQFDHCHAELDCWWRPIPHSLSEMQLAVVLMCSVLFLRAILLSLKLTLKANRLQSQLELHLSREIKPGVHVLESEYPMAFSIGLFKPLAILSTGLISRITKEQSQIICDHELAHLRTRDSFAKLPFHFCSDFFLPFAAKTLRHEYAIALEQRADHIVAHKRGNHLAVAETILLVQRIVKPLKKNISAHPLANAFGLTAIERRVHYLLSDKVGHRFSQRGLNVLLLAILVVLLVCAIPFHNSIETLINH